MMRLSVAVLAILLPSLAAVAQTKGGKGVLGDWREPGGSVIRVAPCGADVCARLIQIRPDAPSQLDIHDPDPAKQSLPLCHLQIGYGFHLTDPDHADGGQIYDPKTGKTYHGTMSAEGDTMNLRGYVGIKAFGRTERWTRISTLKDTCS